VSRGREVSLLRKRKRCKIEEEEKETHIKIVKELEIKHHN
jgi:hypothetical protein